jgi:hypothetical protein
MRFAIPITYKIRAIVIGARFGSYTRTGTDANDGY